MTLQRHNIKVSDSDILMSVLGDLPCLIHLRKMNMFLKHFSFSKIHS